MLLTAICVYFFRITNPRFMEPAELLNVFLAALASFVIGWLWYSPLLFGKIWMKEVWSHQKMEGKASDAIRSMSISIALQVFAAASMAHFLFLESPDGLSSYGQAVETSLWIWGAFMLPLNLSGFLWEGRKFKLAAISAGQSLASLMAIALVWTAIA